MSDFGEALGTAVEGSLFSRAFGGKKGALTDKDGHPIERGHFTEGDCLNCGTSIQGAHCHNCGQKAHLHRTLGAFLHDLLHGALHFDGKTWRTLPKLLFKPGELTRRYIEGERAKFVSPMAMFLFSVFLMFAVFQALGISTPSELPDDAVVDDAVIRAEERAATQLQALEERAASLPEGSQEKEETEKSLAETRKTIEDLEKADLIQVGPDGKFTFKGTGIGWVDKVIDKWRTNPDLMLYKLQANGYKFSWLLIPLSIPFVWLLFAWKRRFKAYDHAIFVTYSLAFISMLFITLSLLSAAGIGGGWVFTALAIIPPVHIYKQLRGTYGISRFSALWRLILLLVFVVVILLMFLQILLLLGAF
ncbi:DUF3667 domain-containing protein [Altererythrobacter arenosus]|uniref:DUF3667 domain-containing protein n=1 Tax=Altererythrobacter arenosus TaxID=3032592 RepID=A0ABY8FVE3_9SPHN|nr:DUF3667 domain-containing protein [Altererythrobacter sp. CAU 1644]WFL75994.1 DUF3667 domain-containing protein [Altererythrobacter sp. CAU 1644]